MLAKIISDPVCKDMLMGRFLSRAYSSLYRTLKLLQLQLTLRFAVSKLVLVGMCKLLYSLNLSELSATFVCYAPANELFYLYLPKDIY